MTLSGPITLINLSSTLPLEFPSESVSIFPRSPTWRSVSVGAPWVFLNGLTGNKTEGRGQWYISKWAPSRLCCFMNCEWEKENGDCKSLWGHRRVCGCDCVFRCFYVGDFGNLQWGPAEVHPFVLSPKAWMCMPLLALASWPLMSQDTVVGADSDACSKVTVPVTFESPRTTATFNIVSVYRHYFFFNCMEGEIKEIWIFGDTLPALTIMKIFCYLKIYFI